MCKIIENIGWQIKRSESLVGKATEGPVPNISNQMFPSPETSTHIPGPFQPVGLKSKTLG